MNLNKKKKELMNQLQDSWKTFIDSNKTKWLVEHPSDFSQFLIHFEIKNVCYTDDRLYLLNGNKCLITIVDFFKNASVKRVSVILNDNDKTDYHYLSELFDIGVDVEHELVDEAIKHGILQNISNIQLIQDKIDMEEKKNELLKRLEKRS